MPWFVPPLLKGCSPAELRAIADGVHAALVKTYAVLFKDRFRSPTSAILTRSFTA